MNNSRVVNLTKFKKMKFENMADIYLVINKNFECVPFLSKNDALKFIEKNNFIIENNEEFL